MLGTELIELTEDCDDEVALSDFSSDVVELLVVVSLLLIEEIEVLLVVSVGLLVDVVVTSVVVEEVSEEFG